MVYLVLWESMLKDFGNYRPKLFKRVLQEVGISPEGPLYSHNINENVKIIFRRGRYPTLIIYKRMNPSVRYNQIQEKHITPQILDVVTKLLEDIKKRADQKEKFLKRY